MQLTVKKDIILENTFLFIFIAAMFWIGLGETWGHLIQHPAPQSYLASDTFQHQTRAQWIKDQGNYRYEAPYYSSGHTDVVGFYPPLLHHISILLSYATGLEIYDTMLFLTVFFAIVSTLVFYRIVCMWNKHVALLSLPLMTYLFTLREARVAFFWGHWPALLGDFFMLSSCWMLANLDKKKASIFLALLWSGTVYGHTAATVFTGLFVVFYLISTLVSKRLTKKQFRVMIIAGIIATLICAYFLILFKQSWVISNNMQLFTIQLDWNGGGGFIQLPAFGYPALAIMTLGGIILVFSRQKDHFFQTYLGIFALLAGLANYIGFAIRAFNFRFYWPIMLSIFFGTGIYALLRLVTKKITLFRTILLSMLLIAAFIKINHEPTGAIQGLVNPYTWQTFAWIRDHTPPDSKPFFFYGDPYDQDGSLGNTHRISTRVEITDLVKTLQKRVIERTYPTKQLVEIGALYPYRTGWFTYGLYVNSTTRINGDRQQRDLCSFDYYVFDTAGYYPVFAQLNELIANTVLQNNFTLVYQNPLNIILKNLHPGGACFGANDSIRF